MQFKMIKIMYALSVLGALGAALSIIYIRSNTYQFSHPQWMAGFETQVYLAIGLGLTAIGWGVYALVSRQVLYAWLPLVVIVLFALIAVYILH
jgi:hypothetical protein